MTKKIKVITIQQNQLLEIPNDNIEVQEDNTENQELPLDIIDIVESQDVNQDITEPIVKVKKPRVKKEKLIPITIDEEPEPIAILDVINVEPELTPKEVKLLQLVKCDKCNRKMTEATLKYKHPISCAGNKPKQPKLPKVPKTKEIEIEPVDEVEDIEDEILTAPPQIPPLKRPNALCPMTARQNKINQKKEQFKALFANAV